jgi:excisionase family DNA binding protein
VMESTTALAPLWPKPETMTVPAAAKRLRIGRNQAYKAAASGQLPTIRMGRRVLVVTAVLDRMLNGESVA